MTPTKPRIEITSTRTLAAATLALAALLALAAGPAAAQITGTRYPGLAWGNPVMGDVNGDGLDDVVAVDLATGDGKVYVNQGDGSPGVPPTFVTRHRSFPRP